MCIRDRVWSAKHAFAAYVPALARTSPSKSYRYGHQILLGQGTDFLFFLKAINAGAVYYDPGIKLEDASANSSIIKARSQFRIKASHLSKLYAGSEIHSLENEESKKLT